MYQALPIVASALLGVASAQKVGSPDEVHPKITTWRCTVAGGCEERTNAIVLDALAHPVYQVDNPSYGCGDWGNPPNATICPDKETCQEACVMDGVTDYAQYGIRTDGDELFLDMLADDDLRTLSPRVYLLTEDEQEYEMLKLTGQEFSFDVDVSKLPCGMNGALYLSEMLPDGGKSDLNTAGAYYGTGYCDAQCYTTPFINGEPNIEGYGSCCNEMDIWEANARATHLAPHPCNVTALVECEGAACEFDGICDKNGCGFNPYRVGHPDYYGTDSSFQVDTSRPFTVVTQFPADQDGTLIEYHRLYVQDGKVHRQPASTLPGVPNINYANDEFCEATGSERYMDLGATAQMGNALTRGMVLAMSVWWDAGNGMEWLNSGEAGPCSIEEGHPDYITEIQPDTSVTFSNMRWGEIGSTFQGSNCTSKH
jgi:cellulase